VVRYPEKQQSPTDLELFLPHDGYVRVERHQFKTAHKNKGKVGWRVKLDTAAGRNACGKQLHANNYSEGDNDFYNIVIPPSEATSSIPGEFHCWSLPERLLLENKIIGEGAGLGFCVHMPDGLQAARGGVASKPIECPWSKNHHRMWL